MRAAVNVHNHHDGRGHHKDIRLFVSDEVGRPTVVHFSSAGGLPGPGRMGRWRALDAPHLSDGAHRVNKSLQGVRGHERFAFESHDDADLHEREGKSGITYLSVGGSRYAISGGTGGVHFVKNLDSVEKVALLKQSEDFSLGQVWLVDRARQMGLIPPDNTAQNPQNAQQALSTGLQSALGTGLKTLSLSFLGGLGAGAGWTLGKRLTAPGEVPNNEKAAEAIPVEEAPDAPAFKPANAAATKTHSMAEHRFGLSPSDPL
jgi:hypothetical protein